MDSRIIDKKLQILQGLAVRSAVPVTTWQARTADHLAPGKYRYDGPWSKIALPARFPAGKTVFLKARSAVPASVPVGDSYLSFGFQDMEGMLSIDGEPYAGLDANHLRVPSPPRGSHSLEAEFMSVPAVYHRPELAGHCGTFASASLIVVNRLIESFCREVRFAYETAKVSDDPRRKPLLEAAVEAALLAVDVTLAAGPLAAEVAAARKLLRRKLAAIAPDPEAGGLFAVGHTHIDTAWLWPLRESVRKCGRTFSTACRLMERYPSFHFACSQPQLYQYTKDQYPDLFRQIKKWVKAGRWETAGAMWVEADCNATSGESLVRQMLYGIRFFQEEFGTRPRMCWLPDVFGYPSSLPEILAGCGIQYFYTYKLHWQTTNPFPDHLFRWRGLDGSEVLAHVVNHVGAYNNYLCPEFLTKGWRLYAQKAEYGEVIFPFGYGDGGGGVTEDMLEQLEIARGQYPGLPAVRAGTAEKYFDDVVAAKPALPLWDGELYVETHRGTYTTQSAMKRANRISEILLRDAELFGSLSALTGHPRALDAQTLRKAWDLTLVNQFHDILPGSSIPMVYVEALAAHEQVQQQARQAIASHLASVSPSPSDPSGSALAVFNSLSWPRQDIVTAEVADRGGPLSVTGPDGTPRPAQVVARGDGKATIVFHADGVPAMGYAVFAVSAARMNAEHGQDAHAAQNQDLHVSKTRLENRFFRINLRADGGISRLWDKVNRRDVLATGATGNDLQLLQDGPESEDAWNIHETIDKRRYPFEGAAAVRVIESGPVRATVRVTRRHRQSAFEQDIVIYADLGRIDFVTRVDWQERHTLLKVAFPLNIRATRATYEVQFGAYERPTHRNTSWEQQKFEVPAQRWADVSETGYGVSLLNDSRYGYDAKENVLRLTLLRSTIFPDPQADRGQHEFTYSLLPHAGGWADAHTVRRAWELNAPAHAMATTLPKATGRAGQHAELASRSFLSLEGTAAVVEALKPAEDGRGFILRVYEPNGARGEVTVNLGAPVQAVRECNLVERDGKTVRLAANSFAFALAPFEIRTFRLMTSKG